MDSMIQARLSEFVCCAGSAIDAPKIHTLVSWPSWPNCVAATHKRAKFGTSKAVTFSLNADVAGASHPKRRSSPSA